MKQKVVMIAGPTAVGKTEYSIKVAQNLGGEIVSADSMQIYRYMNIGSAKPTKKELSMARHYMVDEIDPRTPFSVAEYQKKAKEYIVRIFEKNALPIISGGTGLYVNSLIYDMNFSVVPEQSSLRKRLQEEAITHGNAFIHGKLKAKDPKAALRIHPNNVKKVIRALEILESGETDVRKFEESFVKTKDYSVILIGLNRNRDELYERINRRVDLLMKAGLLQEVQSLLDMGLTESNISMKGIGYKELIDYVHGASSLENAVEQIKKNTRHYAKRQLTWFRRYQEMQWFNLSEFKDTAKAEEAILNYIQHEIS
ncbi:tRNA (adenosine(37)-N6)-dimethylallyltransferase MiaA [Sinanaerobacter sp. ZZT-01]|uniref:tRNA (adenosine(37)-N6)-dimethylallyltransferase MiaA n=1 Tax=Sinanaerobacter sp. ZZT-01 TaxID=3111540 RepID=UPI002D768F63|nr:tRNA (adenosine(37)-N6)-dimethylallyltransferase MiaA [Sinanaerobacter sp. ZZT-01]WRR93119.1 tRNA (adenosine(37)-N6)-dimethylallyltransferase MiaA [Sinanaerobacter sp. ZZT-01]